MDNETLEYRVNKTEEDIKQIKEEIKPIVGFGISINNLSSQLDKLSEQFKEFTEQSNTRSYEWLKYLATLLIGAVATYLFK